MNTISKYIYIKTYIIYKQCKILSSIIASDINYCPKPSELPTKTF